jgi:hypothetical protein
LSDRSAVSLTGFIKTKSLTKITIARVLMASRSISSVFVEP